MPKYTIQHLEEMRERARSEGLGGDESDYDNYCDASLSIIDQLLEDRETLKKKIEEMKSTANYEDGSVEKFVQTHVNNFVDEILALIN